MKPNEYQELAMRTVNKELTKKDMLSNGVMGLCGESGEVIEHVKKHLYHGAYLNIEEIKKELGDVCWYIAEIATSLDLSLEDIMECNIDKLKKRYPHGFEKKKASN